MNSAKYLPSSIRERARVLSAYTIDMIEHMTPEDADRFPGFNIGRLKGDVAVIRAHIEHMGDDATAISGQKFYEVGRIFAFAARQAINEPPSRPQRALSAMNEIDPTYLVVPSAAAESDEGYLRAARLQLVGWLRQWYVFERLWRAWNEPVTPSAKPLSNSPRFILTHDQTKAVNRLEALLNARWSPFSGQLPPSLLSRWTIPFMVGATGTGKAFACEEVARRAGLGFRRWEIGSWLLTASRSQASTVSQIGRFIEENPQGCIVYLAGVNVLAAGGRGDEINTTYLNSIVSEVESLLGTYSRRGGDAVTSVQVVVAGRFSELSGDADSTTATGSDSWRSADKEALSNPRAVANWLNENSRLPAGVLRHLSVEPIVINPIKDNEATEIAARLRSLVPDASALPKSLDGLDSMFAAISTAEIAEALCGPHGWRGVSAMFEQAVIAAHELDANLPAGLPESPNAPERGEGGNAAHPAASK